jgi:hypothetical protein
VRSTFISTAALGFLLVAGSSAQDRPFKPIYSVYGGDTEASCANKAKYLAFSVPGAGTQEYPQGTFGRSIRFDGTVTGNYVDSNVASHGFALNIFTSTGVAFEAPDAGKAYNQGTFPVGINDVSGEITGYYGDSSSVYHGFVREANGKITEFDAPSATGTLPTGLNNFGVVTGFFYDSNGNQHGFVRKANGAIQTFDPPGSTATFPYAINDNGVVTGTFTTGSFATLNMVYQGFSRGEAGTIHTWEAAGAGSLEGQGTVANSLNVWGTIVGTFDDSSGDRHGFLRKATGAFTQIDAPGQGASGTILTSINFFGQSVGLYLDADIVSNPLLRNPDGTFACFASPLENGKKLPIYPESISNAGIVTGSFTESLGPSLGFVRFP